MTDKRQPGWYWVQDMHAAARPVLWDGGIFRASPTDQTGVSWHWPTLRVIAACPPPTEENIRAETIKKEHGT